MIRSYFMRRVKLYFHLSLYISLSFYLSVCISATLLLWCCSYSFKSLWLLVLLLFALVAFTRCENMHHFDRGCFERNQRRAEKKRLHTFNTRAYQLIATSPSIELNWQQIASTYIQKGPYTCNCLLVARDNVWLLFIVVQCVCCFVSLAVRCTVFHSSSSSFFCLYVQWTTSTFNSITINISCRNERTKGVFWLWYTTTYNNKSSYS